MSIETILLLNIIHNAPEGALWIISSDSWREIPELFEDIKIDSKMSEWTIEINGKNKNGIEKIISENDLGANVIHTHLLNKEGDELFSGLDVMSMITINRKFGLENNFQINFPDLEMYYN